MNYAEALAARKAASDNYYAARAAYHAREIGDVEFLAARAAYAATDDATDAVIQAEYARIDAEAEAAVKAAEVAEAAANVQLGLF